MSHQDQRDEIPSAVVQKWQEMVDLLAEIMHVPAALVMKVEERDIKVFLKSASEGNPYEEGETASLNTGLYCETVMNTRSPLSVPNALKDEVWKSNPDVRLGMISYLGFPVEWPNGEIFGTICVLDNKENSHNALHHRLLQQCRDLLQADLGSISSMTGELRTQKKLLDELVARAPIGIIQVGPDHRIVRVNPEFTNIFGYAEAEAVGEPIIDLLSPPELLPQMEIHQRRVVGEREPFVFESVRKHKNGTRVPVSAVIVPLKWQGSGGSGYALYRDITERKRLEDELKCERDRLRLLLEITNSMISKLDLNHLVQVLCTNLLGVMGADQCVLLLPNGEDDQLHATMLYNSEGVGTSYQGMSVPIDGSIAGKVFLAGKSLWIDSFEETYKAQEQSLSPVGRRFCLSVMAEGLQSGCYLPLVSRGRVLGVLAACKRSLSAFAEDEAAFLEQVAHQVALAVENALEYEQATEDRDRETEQKLYLQDEIRTDSNFGEIIGDSRSLKVALHELSIVAPTNSSVLILGETGTGKELIARAIHDLSSRQNRTFVKLNCAAIPLGLLESELFGHEKGAFTGAVAQKIGRFELADKGTLFLDEVGDIPLELQAKLLRVLQEQEFERLGSNKTHKVDVRIIAATHRDLTKMVKQQTFREDLYYRLRVFPIQVPALRDRAEDIPQLVRHFVNYYSRRMNKKIETISVTVMKALTQYPWPGNVRELRNFLERAVILSSGTDLRAPVGELESLGATSEVGGVGELTFMEREHILKALEAANWVVGGPNGAAERLGLKRTSLVYKMQKLGISRDSRTTA